MSKKFYVTEFRVTVLSENPIGEMELPTVLYECEKGDYVLHSISEEQKEVPGHEMANLLYDCGSEPGFFQLDEEGNDLSEKDTE